MGIMDSINPEARVEIKLGDLSTLMKNAAKANLIFNGVNANVPHKYLKAIITVEDCSKEENKK